MAQDRPVNICISSETQSNTQNKNEEINRDKITSSRVSIIKEKCDVNNIKIAQEEIKVSPEPHLSKADEGVTSLTHLKSFASKIKKKVVFDKISRFCQEQTNKIFNKKDAALRPSSSPVKRKTSSAINRSNDNNNNNNDNKTNDVKTNDYKKTDKNELPFNKIINRNIEDRMMLLPNGASYSKNKTRECSDEAGDKFALNSQSTLQTQYRSAKSSYSSFISARHCHTAAVTHRSYMSIDSMKNLKRNSTVAQVHKEIQTLSPSFLNQYIKKLIFNKHTTRDSETQSVPQTNAKPACVIPTMPRSTVSQANYSSPTDSNASSKPVIIRQGHIKPSYESIRPTYGRHLYEPKLLSIDGIKVPVKDRNAVMNWEDYHRLDVIYSFLHNLEDQHPTYCSVFNIGNTIENRDIELIAISNSNARNHSVWLDAGIHGREWIAPAVCTYIINQLCQNFNNQPKYITNKDWYIVPVLNPDGYEYSHTRNRMWRKNRSRYKNMIGVDLNRNFSEGWKDTYDKPGYPATNYGGPEAFSEVESMAVRDMLINNGIKYSIYISLHCYGQMIMFPYSYKPDLCENYVHLLEGATHMCKGIYGSSGRSYKAGLSLDVMHGAHGTSTDWAYEVAKVPFCYTIELRNKVHRFHLPADQIVDCGKEILSSIWSLMKYFDDRGCALVHHNLKTPRYKFSNPRPIFKFNK